MRSRPDTLVPPSDRRRQLAPVTGDGTPAGFPTDDLEWLQGILGVGGHGPHRPHLARTVGPELRLLVPATRGAVTAALSRPGDDHHPLKRLQASAGRGAARLGLVAALPGRRLNLPPFALVDHLAEVLDRPGLLATVTLGPRRRNRKPVLQLVAPDGAVVGYAKVGWSPLTTGLVDNEADVLGRLDGHLPPWITAPTVLHHGPWGTGSVAVASPLDITGGSRRRNGGRPPAPDLVALAQAIATSRPEPPTPVADLAILASWADQGLGDDVDLDRLHHRHGPVELPLGLWHGDLTPWNLATGADGTVVWDWEFAGPARPVGFDLLHHHFERHRRRPEATARTALAVLVADAAAVLDPLHPTGLSVARRDAMVDLYLCELLARERLLAGQRWDSALADVGPAAAELLRHRLARP